MESSPVGASPEKGCDSGAVVAVVGPVVLGESAGQTAVAASSPSPRTKAGLALDAVARLGRALGRALSPSHASSSTEAPPASVPHLGASPFRIVGPGPETLVSSNDGTVPKYGPSLVPLGSSEVTVITTDGSGDVLPLEDKSSPFYSSNIAQPL